MSLYDNTYRAYETVPVTAQNQINRAQYMMNNCPVNSRQVVVPNSQPLNMTQNHVRVSYPGYQLGYNQGATRIFLQPAQANPTPIANQYAHTSVHPYSMFTETDLPPLLFRIEPYRDIFKMGNNDIPVPILYDATTNQEVVTTRGARLRYFWHLPRYIAHDVPGALLEFWFRLDYRLEMNDILMRIETPPGGLVKANNLNMRRNRFRTAINVNSWMDCRTFPPQSDLDVIRQYSAYQICMNTCMKVQVANGHVRFLKPTYNDISCAATSLNGYVDAGVPLNYFLFHPITTFPTRRMIGIMALLQRTQELAIALGHGIHWDNYKLLSEDDAPPWWNDRRTGEGQAEGRQIRELGYWTWREIMVFECGRDMEVGVAKRAKTRGWQV